MKITAHISKKKIILYSIILAILLIGIVILLIQREASLSPVALPSGTTVTPSEQPATENAEPVSLNNQTLNTIIDTELFSNKKFQSLKKNTTNIANKYDIGKRDPFAPTENNK